MLVYLGSVKLRYMLVYHLNYSKKLLLYVCQFELKIKLCARLKFLTKKKKIIKKKFIKKKMAVARLVSKFMKAYEAKADTSSVEEMLSVVISGCIDDDSFYDLPMDAICRIVHKRGEIIKEDEASKFVTKLVDKHGQNAAQILTVLDCGPIGYFDAASVVSPLRVCPVVRELLDARPTTARTGGEYHNLERKIRELEKKNSDMKKELEENRKKLRAKSTTSQVNTKELEEKLSLLLPDEKDIVEAAESGNLKAVKYYATIDPKSISQENSTGYTALQTAALGTNEEIAAFLISKGADVNHVHQKGDTCLHFAALGGNLNIVKMLLKHGANLRAVDNSGMNALHYAAQGGNLDVVKFLVEQGLDPKAEADGTTTFWLAAYSGDVCTFAYFMDLGIDKDKPNKDGLTPLHAAAMGGNKDIADVLIDFGLDINAKSKDGLTPLDVAEDQEMIDFLHGKLFGGNSDSDEEEEEDND